MKNTARGCVLFDERPDERTAVLGDRFQPDSAGFSTRETLHRANDEHLSDGALPLTAHHRVGVLSEREGGLIDLHLTIERGTIRIHHRPTQLVEKEPGGLVGPDSDLGLELKCGNRVGMGCHQVGRNEPDTQRQVSAVHNRSRDHRGLSPARLRAAAARTLIEPRPGFKAPALGRAAMGADEAIGPPLLGKVFSASVVVRKIGHKPLDRRRLVVLPSGRKQGMGHIVNIHDRPRSVICRNRLWLSAERRG